MGKFGKEHAENMMRERLAQIPDDILKRIAEREFEKIVAILKAYKI